MILFFIHSVKIDAYFIFIICYRGGDSLQICWIIKTGPKQLFFSKAFYSESIVHEYTFVGSWRMESEQQWYADLCQLSRSVSLQLKNNYFYFIYKNAFFWIHLFLWKKSLYHRKNLLNFKLNIFFLFTHLFSHKTTFSYTG